MRTWAGVTLGILVPLVVIPVAVFVAYRWYRRRMKALAVDGESRDMPGVRLTSETLRRLPPTLWRVVYEIRPTQLEGADHVVIGPCGVIALTTVVADRPTGAAPAVSAYLPTTGLVKAAVDQHTEVVGVRCDRVVKVYWGAPQHEMAAARDGTNGVIEVEGQRLASWLHSLPPGPLVASQVDSAWRAVVTGIGRPDPLP